MLKELNAEVKVEMAKKILNGEPVIATFNYVDGKGRETRRRVRLDTGTPDDNGNWTFYNYATDRTKGGIRSFKGIRITDFKLVGE